MKFGMADRSARQRAKRSPAPRRNAGDGQKRARRGVWDSPRLASLERWLQGPWTSQESGAPRPSPFRPELQSSGAGRRRPACTIPADWQPKVVSGTKRKARPGSARLASGRKHRTARKIRAPDTGNACPSGSAHGCRAPITANPPARRCQPTIGRQSASRSPRL